MQNNVHLHLCRSCRNLNSLLKIHARLIISGLTEDASTNTHLINSYSLLQRCNLARAVFDSLPTPSVMSWNSMIRAYSRSYQNQEALNMYHHMLEKGMEPDKYTYTFVLKACTATADFQHGLLVHREVARKQLESDVFICTALIGMYCKAGDLETARMLFDKLPERDVAAWNAMIAGLSQSSSPRDSLILYSSMQLTGVKPNSVSLLNLLPAVSRLADFDTCRCVHAYVTRRNFGLEVSNALCDTYAKCGRLESASLVFDLMYDRDDVSWSTMMAGFTHNGCFSEVLELYDDMKEQTIWMNKLSIVSALLAAGETKNLEKGEEIHQLAVEQGVDSDVLVATPIMTMYAKCGEMEKVAKLFEGLRKRDLVVWSALVAAFVQSGDIEKALSVFRDMQEENLKPNGVTLVSVLSACTHLSSLRLSKSIHCYAIKADIDSIEPTGTALVSVYAKCGYFGYARAMFDVIQCKDVVTWNALINGYVQIGDAHQAIKMYQKLQFSGLRPDRGTMLGLILVFALLNDLKQGTSVHALVIKGGFESYYHANNALIDMYCKCGSLPSALHLFNQAGFVKVEVSWNTVISGHMQNGEAEEALSAFHRMRLENIQPNLVTFVIVLSAVAYLAAVRQGMGFHGCIIKMGLLPCTMAGNSLIAMYAKCGQIDLSKQCFDEMEDKDTVSWNSMLAGLAVHGKGAHAVELFSLMQQGNIELDSTSYVNVLSACRHAGLIGEGKKLFSSMQNNCQIQPNVEHYACMVDLLARAGLFNEAIDLIEKMPMKPDAGVWGALLGACRMHYNLRLGEVALNHLIEIEPGNPTHFVVLSTIYAQTGRWADAEKIRSNVKVAGLKKTPGSSWVEVNNRIHAFLMGDLSHPQYKKMQLLWDNLREKMEKVGYVPDKSCVIQNVEEEDKELFLQGHSERLAITFALLNTEPESTIQIVKNLRVCVDCHTATKYIARITRRKIIVRDSTRFHHFDDGICSCGDYW